MNQNTAKKKDAPSAVRLQAKELFEKKKAFAKKLSKKQAFIKQLDNSTSPASAYL
ncbi:hypothetical protein L2734_18225 [Parashewanella spongiae]|uniref:hypothetical protein n=1 Tax=Parashewanella spongiae TaxID=342950 RepID=UPI001404AF6A|nr:hypothetical protein [Parashewanella spongiae]MCL1080068.1 hypothetical protein [Parashewanella spongiae]